ncbi:MAG: hypothetical protein ACT4PT_08200 [Methanobacteriota archaeon]
MTAAIGMDRRIVASPFDAATFRRLASLGWATRPVAVNARLGESAVAGAVVHPHRASCAGVEIGPRRAGEPAPGPPAVPGLLVADRCGGASFVSGQRDVGRAVAGEEVLVTVVEGPNAEVALLGLRHLRWRRAFATDPERAVLDAEIRNAFVRLHVEHDMTQLGIAKGLGEVEKASPFPRGGRGPIAQSTVSRAFTDNATNGVAGGRSLLEALLGGAAPARAATSGNRDPEGPVKRAVENLELATSLGERWFVLRRMVGELRTASPGLVLYAWCGEHGEIVQPWIRGRATAMARLVQRAAGLEAPGEDP